MTNTDIRRELERQPTMNLCRKNTVEFNVPLTMYTRGKTCIKNLEVMCLGIQDEKEKVGQSKD